MELLLAGSTGGRAKLRHRQAEAASSDGSSDGVAIAPSSGAKSAGDRIARLIAALQDERALSQFEAAVLAELCEQRADQVLAVVSSDGRSVAAKKQFLLELARGSDRATTTTAAAAASSASRLGNARQERPTPRRLPDVRAGLQTPPQRPDDLHVELVLKKVLAIARSVFSPQMQMQITSLAAAYRTKQQQQQRPVLDDAHFTRAMELLGVVEKLLNKHALPEEQSGRLIDLVLADNRLLVSALQAFKQDCNWPDLESTVKRIAALGDHAEAKAASPRNVVKSPRKTKGVANGTSPRRSKSSGTPRGDRKTAKPSAAPPAPTSGAGVMLLLHQKRMLTTLEYDILRALVGQDDRQVLALLGEYDLQSVSLAELREALVTIVDEITTELGDEEKAAFARGVNDAALEELADDLVHWQQHVLRFVQLWRDERRLTAEHAQVLEEMTVQRHNLLQSAYEVFANDHDESELFDTLERVAKLQVRAEEAAAQELFSEVVDGHCPALREPERALVKQLFARKSELVLAAWEVFEEEQNVDDLSDTLLRIARFTTRNDSKLRLVEVVGEMMRRGLVHSHEADGLIRLFEERNDAVLAANEAFEADGDVKELVETLLLVVKHANFGSPPVCSPRNGHHAAKSLGRAGVSAMDFAPGSESFAVARLIELIAGKGQLSAWQTELLLRLVADGDVRVLAAVDLYNEDQHLRELVDTLQRLTELVAWLRGKAQIAQHWIAPLAAAGRIPSQAALIELLEKRDDRVMAAFSVYLEDQNSAEFSDSLARIAAVAGREKRITRRSELEYDEAKSTATLTALVAAGLLSGDDKNAVQDLLKSGDARTLAAFDVFDATMDREDLADTLTRVLALERRAAAGRSHTGRMEKQLLHLVSELKLEAPQAAALKRAIAAQDAEIEAAVSEFLEAKDEVRVMVECWAAVCWTLQLTCCVSRFAGAERAQGHAAASRVARAGGGRVSQAASRERASERARARV